MDLQRIAAIFQKDFVASVRDSRFLLALIVPIGLGLLYNFALDDERTVPEATVVYADAGQSSLPDVMNSLTGESVRLTFSRVEDVGEVQRRVAMEKADLGLVLPDEFDTALARGDAPEIVVDVPESPATGGSIATALLEPALRQLAGQHQPASVTVNSVSTGSSDSVVDRVGERRFGVLTAAIMTIAMIGMFVVPMVLADESEKKTLDALVLIASDVDVIVAKALFGLSYIAISVALLFALTDVGPATPLPFVAGLLLLSATLVGLGLLLGGVLNVSQLNTWAGLIIVVVLAPSLIIGMSVPGWVEAIAAIFPTLHAARLALNGISGEALFPYQWGSVVVLTAWCIAMYGLLLWRLSHREA